MTELSRKERLIQLKKGIVKDIEKIETKIHQIVLTGKYTYNDLQEKIGPLAVVKPTDIVKSGIAKGYNITAYKQLENSTLSILINPNKGFIPQCKIRTSYPTQEYLFKLSQSLPKLNISKVECTVDIFYPNPRKVRRYFRLIRRNLYVPHQLKNMNLYSDKYGLKYSKNNMSLYAGSIKFYERGNDEDKNISWAYDKINRLRIELTADNRIINKYNLRNLSDFLESLRFEDIFKNRFYFKRFDSSVSELPREDEFYTTKDNSGFGGSFSAEYGRVKDEKIYKNPAQYLENVKGLEVFKEKIFSNIRKFDEKWSNRHIKYEKKDGS